MAFKKNHCEEEQADGYSSGLIHQYEEIATASRSMLDAAHRGDWCQVKEIEERCQQMIAALKLASPRDALGDREQRRRIALLRSILNDDAQIRVRAEPWLRDLEDFLRSAPQAQKPMP
ncbi:Flagellar chaperone (modular protein) [Burkholderiales bacterium]|jgi:flagellar protein FliT|nr:Flagellar chaperone (modular protein) [Burkholderiales bacterium]